MGLHVGVLGAEQGLGAIDRQLFGHVDELATAVVTLAGISLGVLVRQHGAGGFEHGWADEVFGRDQLQAFTLPTDFILDGLGDLRVGRRKMGHRYVWSNSASLSRRR